MNRSVALEVHKHFFLFSPPQKQKASIKADCKVCQFFCQNLSMLVKGVLQSRVLKPQSIPIKWLDLRRFWELQESGHCSKKYLCRSFRILNPVPLLSVTNKVMKLFCLQLFLTRCSFYQVLRAKQQRTELSEIGSPDLPSVQLSTTGFFFSDKKVTNTPSYPLCKHECTATMPKFQEGRKKTNIQTNALCL